MSGDENDGMRSTGDNVMRVNPRVSIIILNWNGWRDTLECLESVYQITYPRYDVIVADNGSEDNSIEQIEAYARGKLEVTSKFFQYSSRNKPIECCTCSREEIEAGGGANLRFAKDPSSRRLLLIKNGKNYGFSGGNNSALRFALEVLKSDYILLLNNDTVVDPSFLDRLVEVAESDPAIGFAGPKSYYYDYHGRTDVINFAGGHITMWKGKSRKIGLNETDRGQYGAIADVDYVEGSCLLARSETLMNIGLLDPAYFLYWDDTDWSVRARNAGFRLVYVPGARIWHKEAVSSGKKKNSVQEYYVTRNRSWFVMRNGTRLERTVYLLYLMYYLVPFKLGASLLYHRDPRRYRLFLKGVYDGLFEG